MRASSIAQFSAKRPRIDAKELYDSQYQTFSKSAIYSIIPGYASLHQKSTVSTPEPELPETLKSLYSKKYESCTTFQVLRLAKMKVSSIVCTSEQANFLEKATHGQSNSILWFDHRLGHITASIMGRVTKCQEKVFPNSLFKNIMQYSKPNMNIPALKWGRLNEDKARKQYQSHFAIQHLGFRVRLCGFHIYLEHPYLGATPDGIVSCDCCGEGLLEVKCPYSHS